MPDYRDILKQYWGYDGFRGIQQDIIESIGQGKDTLGLMPTGGGKSVTFQVPALAREGMCLVVTPLIALMKDQVQNLRKRGIRALALYSGMSREDIVTTLENCIFGGYKFLYISPERLATDIFRVKLRKMHISMIAVDESHCISQWGYDFRPAYLKIAEVREMLPGVPVLALTATATPEVVDDIQKRLGFREPNVFRMSFRRDNLVYVVRHTTEKINELVRILNRVEGSAIVYVRSRMRAEEVCELLNQKEISALFYHAGLDGAVRDLRQRQWQGDECRVIVATNAFGMGIDKPDVRLVVHLDLPDSIEAYFQEAGRAGRDGKKAYAVMLHDASADRGSLLRSLASSFPDKSFVKEVYEHLQYYFQMAMGDGRGCVKKFDLTDFCVKFRHYPVAVESALRLLTMAGYLEYMDEVETASRLHFTLRRDELYRLHTLDDKTELLVRTLLRTYTGLFSDDVFISEDLLAVRSGLPRKDVYGSLIRISRLGIARYIPHQCAPYIIYTRERIDASRIQLPPSVYEERKVRSERRVLSMLDYVGNDTACRSRQLLAYFGETESADCGQCDVCLARKRSQKSDKASDVASRILSLFSEKDVLELKDLATCLQAESAAVSAALNRLADEKRIVMKDGQVCLSENKTLFLPENQ